MADKIVFIKKETIEIDLKAERDRINTPRMFNKSQRKVLNKIIDLFEVCDFNELVSYIKSSKQLKIFEYSVMEYISEDICDVLEDVIYSDKVYLKKEE